MSLVAALLILFAGCGAWFLLSLLFSNSASLLEMYDGEDSKSSNDR